MIFFQELLGYLGGVSVVLTGLFAYLGKIRLEAYKNDLDITKQKLKSLLEHSTHVTKAQFDKEFSIYQEIWSALIPLRQYTLSLRPIFEHVSPNETEEERIKNKLTIFGKAFVEYRDLIEKFKPFYSSNVYESLFKILDLCHSESIDYQYKPTVELRAYWEAQKKSREAITTEIDSCCNLIRQRIESLAIID